MFCVECGKEEPIYKNGLCAQCYVKSTTFTSGPSLLTLIQCSKCNAFKYKNTWTNNTIQVVLLQLVKDTFNINPELQELSYHLDCQPIESQFPCEVTITGKLQGISVEETHHLPSHRHHG